MAVARIGDPTLSATSYIPSLHSAALDGRGNRQPYSDWYLGDPQARWLEPAKDAYDSALSILQKELSADEYQRIGLKDHNSLQDVQRTLIIALDDYQTKSRGSRTRAWLASCSSRFLYYGSVFDTFAQHHPEYVSLAWGTFKFLFIAVLNHEEQLAEISKAITNIADVLPWTELHAILYLTPRMQEAVSLVYAKIIEFSIQAIKWYKKGKLVDSISSITKPFSLSFKPILEAITERSRRVDELASAASKAEIRDLHVRIHGLDRTLVQLTERLSVQQQQQTLHNQSLFTLQSEYKHMFCRGQIEEIQNTLLLGGEPTPDESLAYCRSTRNRRRQKMPTQLPVPALSKLKSWVSDPESSILLAQGQGVRTSSLDFAADFVDAVLAHGYPTLLTLPSTIEEGRGAPSFTAILRSLILQILNLNSSVVSEGAHPVTIKHFKSAASIQQWLALLERCISSFPHLFVIIDTALIEMAVEHEEAEREYYKLGDFIEDLSGIVGRRNGGGLKIVLVSWRFSTITSIESNEVFGDRQIFTDTGKKMQRLIRQPKYRAIFRRRNQAFAERLMSSVQVVDP